jgi:hypothetical protein
VINTSIGYWRAESHVYVGGIKDGGKNIGGGIFN